MPQKPPLHHDLLAAFAREAWDEGLFNSLAVRIFNYQYKHNTAYRNYCGSLGVEEVNVTDWKGIPAVPTDVFKIENCPVITFPHHDTEKTFLTSGTTTETRGQHHFPTLELYEASILRAWEQLHLPHPEKAFILTPHPDDAPHSSLSHMMGVLANAYGEQVCWSFTENGGIDPEPVTRACQLGHPVALLGTALAFLHLFDQLEQPLTLPDGSWAMETGGYKGSTRKLQKEDLYALFHQQLGLQHDAVINEYSMTELSSQYYSRGTGHPHRGARWTRVRVIDPMTGDDVPVGHPGHLVIYDLANLYSTIAIRTQDVAIRNKDNLAAGGHSFTLLGRDPSALPRGCSRAADHHLGS